MVAMIRQPFRGMHRSPSTEWSTTPASSRASAAARPGPVCEGPAERLTWVAAGCAIRRDMRFISDRPAKPWVLLRLVRAAANNDQLHRLGWRVRNELRDGGEGGEALALDELADE